MIMTVEREETYGFSNAGGLQLLHALLLVIVAEL